MHNILLDNHYLMPYTLKRYKRSKRVNMIMHHDGMLVVTAPQRYPLLLIERILRKNQQWILARHKKNTSQNNVTIEKVVVRHVKDYVRTLVEQKCAYYNRYYHFSYQRISIRQQRTRWGSCSTQGNLNFNMRLIYLPEHLRNYVIVHELCHLQEMNHSASFWSLVEAHIPTYKKDRKELRAFAL